MQIVWLGRGSFVQPGGLAPRHDRSHRGDCWSRRCHAAATRLSISIESVPGLAWPALLHRGDLIVPEDRQIRHSEQALGGERWRLLAGEDRCGEGRREECMGQDAADAGQVGPMQRSDIAETASRCFDQRRQEGVRPDDKIDEGGF